MLSELPESSPIPFKLGKKSRERLTTYNHTTSALKGIRMADFPSASDLIDNNNVIKSNISAYRKGQFTTRYLYAMKEKVTKHSEVNMMMLADYSLIKAFDIQKSEIFLPR